MLPLLSSDKWGLPPSELDNMAYWEYQTIVNRIVELVENENGKTKTTNDTQREDTHRMMQQSKRSFKQQKLPKTPKMKF